MLRKLDPSAFGQVFAMMEESFPLEEYRTYEEQKALLQQENYCILGHVDPQGELGGFMAVWEFANFVFLEHFVVKASCRNQGLGSQMLGQLRELYAKAICLEAEPPEDELTRRRVDFYKRNGFSVSPFPYMQPSISHGRIPIPLVILTTHGCADAARFSEIKRTLYEQVYHVSLP